LEWSCLLEEALSIPHPGFARYPHAMVIVVVVDSTGMSIWQTFFVVVVDAAATAAGIMLKQWSCVPLIADAAG
jgi:hypothetical protein